MTYRPPVSRILLAMKAAGALQSPDADLSAEDAEAILTEAGRIAADRIAPLNRTGDRHPAVLNGTEVTTPPGWRDAYAEWRSGGWNGLTATAEYGGQELPMVMEVACTELWNSACMSFALCPLLTGGAIEALSAHASPELKERYLPKLISGEWSGTMNLTEPQAGSDLSLLRCVARRDDDGGYRITGNKIFITYGEHDCATNIIHLVLARLPDAPPGTHGLSLFLVPKLLTDGTRNDLHCAGLEHKLGIHGSPTCSMVYGDKGGAKGWLVGEENQGLACMFTMMNNARLLVGVQGVAIAERATQMAVTYSAERRQGRGESGSTGPAPINQHPDVRRMLGEMRGKTAAARMLCMATALAIDESTRSTDPGQRRSAAARASLLTPLAKAYSTDIAVEVASSAIQVYGGMGFVEETGVAQLYRDARILPIYEGTNGIQAIDLVSRKLGLENGDTLREVLDECRTDLGLLIGDAAANSIVSRLAKLASALQSSPAEPDRLIAATPFLRALASAVAGGYLSRAAKEAVGSSLESETLAMATSYACTEIGPSIAAAEGALDSAPTVYRAHWDA